MTIAALYRKFKAVDTDKIIEETMTECADALNSQNLEQLFDGKTKEGTNITPSYLQDPYFKTPEAAKKYSNWKDQITPSDKRSPGTPNLYINGRYHRSRRITVTAGSITHSATDPAAAKIESKFKDIDGLGGEYKTEFLKQSVQPLLKQKIQTATGLIMK